MSKCRRMSNACVAIAVALPLFACAAPAAQAAASFGVRNEDFEAGTCTENTASEPCSYKTPEKFYTQAAGRPPFGITYFKLNAKSGLLGEEPIGSLKRVRVDIPAGLSVNPFAVPRCALSAFEAGTCKSETVIGEEEAVAVIAGKDETVKGTIFNLEAAEGLPAEFGVAIEALPAPLPSVIHILIEGGLSWHAEPEGQPEGAGVAGGPSGDYHEYFNIRNISNSLPILSSKLIFYGNAGTGLITMPSNCSGPESSYLEVESYEGEISRATTSTPVGASGCEKIPFKPSVTLTPSSTQSDRPDGATIEVKVPQQEEAAQLNSSTVEQATVNLPEGMSLNPALANGLQACTDAQFARGSATRVSCPAASKIGTVTIETPMLPAKTLTGGVYVAQPIPGATPESGAEYRIFMDAEAPSYGVSVRLEGRVSANQSTGQLSTLVAEDPPLPFSDFMVKLEGASQDPLANPLACGPARSTATLTPFSGTGPISPFSSFTVDFDGKGGACPSPLPFAPGQATSASPATGGAFTTFTLNLGRGEGEQYLGSISSTLPEGLIGRIPAVTLCGEPAAAQGSCPAASRIGSATAAVGSGSNPYSLTGPVYLTGAYGGAPFGLSIAMPAEKVGPYDFGTIVTRASVAINPQSTRVSVASTLPRIVGGVPIRLRNISVRIDRAGFLSNPTSCAALATETTLGSTTGTTHAASTPFQALDCQALAFKPQMRLESSAHATRRDGAPLNVSITMPPGQANIREVHTVLPPQLGARLSTLKEACAAATFQADPASCPPASAVGSVTVATPALPGTLSGPAYFVSHGGAAFPDLDLVLQGDGVSVILSGSTAIEGEATHTNFTSVPDVPFTSFQLSLPTAPNSALSATANLCAKPLHMAVAFTGQNGATLNEEVPIAVPGCAARTAHHRGHRLRRHRHGGCLHAGRHHHGRHHRARRRRHRHAARHRGRRHARACRRLRHRHARHHKHHHGGRRHRRHRHRRRRAG